MANNVHMYRSPPIPYWGLYHNLEQVIINAAKRKMAHVINNEDPEYKYAVAGKKLLEIFQTHATNIGWNKTYYRPPHIAILPGTETTANVNIALIIELYWLASKGPNSYLLIPNIYNNLP
jgi:hypothetical protein